MINKLYDLSINKFMPFCYILYIHIKYIHMNIHLILMTRKVLFIIYINFRGKLSLYIIICKSNCFLLVVISISIDNQLFIIIVRKSAPFFYLL